MKLSQAAAFPVGSCGFFVSFRTRDFMGECFRRAADKKNGQPSCDFCQPTCLPLRRSRAWRERRSQPCPPLSCREQPRAIRRERAARSFLPRQPFPLAGRSFVVPSRRLPDRTSLHAPECQNVCQKQRKT